MSSRLKPQPPSPLASPSRLPRTSHAPATENDSTSLTPCRRQPLAASPFACSSGPGARAALSSSLSLRYDSFQPWRRLPINSRPSTTVCCSSEAKLARTASTCRILSRHQHVLLPGEDPRARGRRRLRGVCRSFEEVRRRACPACLLQVKRRVAHCHLGRRWYGMWLDDLPCLHAALADLRCVGDDALWI